MPRRSDRCAACGHVFEPRQVHRSALFERPEGYTRSDYCLPCDLPADADPLAVWHARRGEPRPARTGVFDRAVTLSFFLRLEGAPTPEAQQFRFILAMLLWRKKVLRFDRTERPADGGEIWHFSRPGTDAAHAVVRWDLEEEQIEALSAQIEHLLGGDEEVDEALEAPAPARQASVGPDAGPAEPANA